MQVIIQFKGDRWEDEIEINQLLRSPEMSDKLYELQTRIKSYLINGKNISEETRNNLECWLDDIYIEGVIE